ncbi:MAG: MotA/TolQ/ExbB proton channel family protein [Coriobacteriia bacterium]|nr:MotA/TolQ/ExbB proton channel family protein [Coriobacteriia bacterium]
MNTFYMKDMLHLVAQGMLVPTMALLIVLIGYAIFLIGSVIAEYYTERRHYKVTMPQFINAINDAKPSEVVDVIEESGLLRYQKSVLVTLAHDMDLPDDDLFALAKSLVFQVNERYRRVIDRVNLGVKVAPMLGLMGTLIPLGPGIVALGQGDAATLSTSLLIAFDTTVAGMIIAVVCLVVANIRKHWYEAYIVSVESIASCILQKAVEKRTGVEKDVAEDMYVATGDVDLGGEQADAEERVVVDKHVAASMHAAVDMCAGE